jgi:hypothetical protein
LSRNKYSKFTDIYTHCYKKQGVDIVDRLHRKNIFARKTAKTQIFAGRRGLNKPRNSEVQTISYPEYARSQVRCWKKYRVTPQKKTNVITRSRAQTAFGTTSERQ